MIMKHTIITLALCFCAAITWSQTLKDALKAKDTVLALSLIAKGADPNAKDDQGATLLMSACHFPDIPIASFLLRHGAKPDEPRSAKGRTALMVACAYWCGMDMVKLLVAYGADVNAAALDGTTPLMLAAMNEKQDVVDYLLSKGANAAAKDSKGMTALDYARNGKVEEYMTSSIKDTRFNKEAVMASLTTAMKH
jgi:ankyrin repeat protein